MVGMNQLQWAVNAEVIRNRLRVGLIRMNKDIPPSRAGRSGPTGRAVITPEVAAELQPLYDELPTAAEAAAEALRIAAATPTSLALLKFRQRAARVDQIIDRIRAILG